MAMRSDIDSLQEKMDRLLEAMMSMVNKDDNLEIDVDARNIAAQIRFSSFNILRVANLEFGFPPRYVHS